MELIKINKDHYVIIDNLDIKEGDFFLNETTTIEVGISNYNYKSLSPKCKKITHSTKPLEDVIVLVRPDGSDVSETIFDKVKEISLSEVKKLIGDVNLEELELIYHQQLIERREVARNFRGQVAGNHPDMFTSREILSMMEGYSDGYTQALEDNKSKNKQYTEEDMRYMFECGRNYQNNAEVTFKVSMDFIKHRIEWEVEFVDGKLKLK
jgi:hypothetical protein